MQMENSKLNKVDPLEMLFKARWNVPRAAKELNISNEECKHVFKQYFAKKIQNES
jgi:hypothetical protein